MAVMKKFTIAELVAKGSMKVGNNRVAEHHPKDDVFVGKLHGNTVFEYSRKENKICVDFFGYASQTTGAAIRDFLGAFGFCGRVGRNGDKVTFNLGGVEVVGTVDNPITISL